MNDVDPGVAPRRKLLSSAAAKGAAKARGLKGPAQLPRDPNSNKQRRRERIAELLALFRERWPSGFSQAMAAADRRWQRNC